MVVWTQFQGGSSEWDELLLESKDYTIFQTYAWGEFKKIKGWLPLRLVGKHPSKGVVGMVQVLIRMMPFGFGIGWAAGGPVMYFNNGINLLTAADLSTLLSYLHGQHPKVLFRFHSHLLSNSKDSYLFRQVFKSPYLKINSGFTIALEINKGEVDFSADMSSKHRYYFKRAKNISMTWSHDAGDLEIEELAGIHKDMVSIKKLKESPVIKSDLILLRNKIGLDRVSTIIGYLNDVPVVGCMTYDFGGKSIYMIAGSTYKGREANASYAMVGELIQVLRNKGVKEFDFGGIDPANPEANGVNHFKRGFGGMLIEHLGEWESASSQTLRLMLNMVLWIKEKMS